MSMLGAIEELVQGHKYASKLHHLLLHQPHDDDDASAQDLVLKILTSFSHTLSVLMPDSSHPTVSSSIHHHHHDYTETRRPQLKDKRGCYKRKRSGPTRIVASPFPAIDDGHSWRKYGQKEILNSKHPRNYFRCTKKYEQGCVATKQVQKMEGNPQMYQITYIGNHTCKVMTPQIIPDSNSSWDWPGGSSNMSEPPQTKQHVSDQQQDSVMWKDLMAGFGDDSSKTTCNNPILEMDHQFSMLPVIIKTSPSVDNFDSDFSFEETEFHLGL